MTGPRRRRHRLAALTAGLALAVPMALVPAWAAVSGPDAPRTLAAAFPDPGSVTGDIGVHDPEVVKTADGRYLLVHTGDNLVIKASADRTAWQNAGAVFPQGAPWTLEFTGGSRELWAPDITFADGQFLLYYSASTFGSRNSAIFLATSPTGASGTWTDRGLVIRSGAADDFNAIDPSLVIDGDRRFLAFGSFSSGLKMIDIDNRTGLRSGDALRSIAGRGDGGAIEAPTIVRNGAFFYQFVSFDRCCNGADSTYRIMVGRSTTVTGPYVDRAGVAMTAGGGTEILAGHGSFHGTGHQTVLGDTDGDVLFYHFYADDDSSKLGINLLGYDADGWPFVR
jgi:arabinan endo-1,5-alpha-L-arabinosidase